MSINGNGIPKFAIYNGITFKETIELPLTNKKGLIETPEEKTASYETIDFETITESYGWKIYFKLHYDEYTSDDTTAKIIKLLNYEKNGHRIILTPRNDIQTRYFEVKGLNRSINVGVLKSGNRLIELNYVTRYLIPNLDAINPLDIRYIGQSLPQCCGILQT